MSSAHTVTPETTAELVLKARRGQMAVNQLKAAFDKECARRMKALRRIESLGFESMDEASATKGGTLFDIAASIDPEHRTMLDRPTQGLTPATI